MTLSKTISYTFVGIVLFIALFVALPTFAATTTGGWTSVSLSGLQEVPSVLTTTTGQFRFKVADSENSMEYALDVHKGEHITAAHIHCAAMGQNGPVIADLFHSTATSGIAIDGTLASGTLMNNNVLPAGVNCAIDVTDIDSLEDALENGILYVNVHSVAYPSGLIRGQLSDEHEDEDEDDDTDENDDDENDGDDDPKTDRIANRLEATAKRLEGLLERKAALETRPSNR